ncbi:TetR/AcrR family transcriptional regulator [Nocardia sp. CDC153]|uniref:TetR/AcrR family transcriptional regulator n=1 Tax=Nocardia sp. CDC153 TaxID=3112167 RepID=UPI002DB5A843|nr:TetR/AcrR family transcriptional regulator [Nocardia sp. CDC153]MEC3951988.1 TetR/AcrR family transcriptional regulator [Nocardia sp. CDC153]
MAGPQPSPTVWARPRRERPALTVERIVDEAVSLMDAEGIDALTMRALGARLGAGATSMYRHVANREELLELAVDRAYAEIRVPRCEQPEHWREAVSGYARSMRSMVARHGWIAAALPGVGLYYLGPNVLRLSESLNQVFEVAGFPAAEIDMAITAVLGYAVGMCVAESAWLTKVGRSGKSEQECLAELQPVIERALADHPRIAQLRAARGEVDIRAVRDAKFNYGLDRMLDGLRSRPIGGAA